VLVCTITLIISSVAATKKKKATKNAIKKAKELKHYSANPHYFFESDINYLSFTVENEPVPLNPCCFWKVRSIRLTVVGKTIFHHGIRRTASHS